jgi:hypothetical protein
VLNFFSKKVYIMSSNRLVYDKDTYQKAVQESTDPLNYMLYTGKFVRNNQCMISRGVVGGNNVSVWAGNMVDLESNLMGVDRRASLCPKNHYHPMCKNNGKLGLPSGTYDCQGNLTNKSVCNMIKYRTRMGQQTFPSQQCNFRN